MKNKLSKFSSKGFTLIELIIVIAILGILATAVVVGIDPVRRINAARDSKIRQDFGQVAPALETYYTQNGTTGTAYYPLTGYAALTTALTTTTGILKTFPAPAVAGDYTYLSYVATGGTTACTNAVGAYCGAASLSAPVKNWGTVAQTGYASVTTATSVWCWRSASGTVALAVDAAACQP